MTVDLIRPQDLETIAPVWDRLALRSPRDAFFRTYGWYRAWMDHIRPDAEPFVLAARDGRGEIVAIAPLCRAVFRDLGFRIQTVSWGGRDVVSGDFLDFVAEPEARPEAVSAMLDYLDRSRSRFGLLHFGELLEGAHSYSAVEEMAKRLKLPLRRQEERICPYIALPASFDAYLATLGSSTRYHVRRRIRDVSKKGAAVQVYDEPADVANGLDILIRLHGKRWRKDGLPGALGRPGFAAFLQQICSRPPAGSEGRLYVLRHAGSAAAALLMFDCGESAMYYQAGWDPESPVAALSPAVVLMASSIRESIERGCRYYEFLRGDEAYKSLWTKTCRRTTTLLVGRSFMGKQYLRAARMKDVLKGALGRQGASRDEVGVSEGLVKGEEAGRLV